MSCASTDALGHLAKPYYAGGRTPSMQVLKVTYATIVQQGQAMYQRHLPAIQDGARTLDVQQVLANLSGR